MLKSNTNNNEFILFQVTTAEKVKKKKKTQKNDFNQSFSFTDQVITYKYKSLYDRMVVGFTTTYAISAYHH